MDYLGFERLESKGIVVPFKAKASDGLAWVGRIEDPNAIAAPVHEMVMPVRPVARVDQMFFWEEASCWDTAFMRASLVLKEPNIKGVAVIVNDGIPAGQTVGHVHFHVLGLSDGDLVYTLHSKFNELTKLYSALPLNPVASVKIDRYEGGDRLTARLRSARHGVRNKHRATLSGIGYNILSVCTDTPQSTSPSLMMEAWSEQERRPFGMTNLTRVLNKLRDKPYSWPVSHLNQYFRPD